jgi:hypothetical protein
MTTDYLKNVAYGSARVGEAFLFLQDQLLMFAQLSVEAGHDRRPLRLTSQLQSALMRKHSLAHCQFTRSTDFMLEWLRNRTSRKL